MSQYHPVPNKWGQQGWTFVELGRVKKEVFRDALACAYDHVSGKAATTRKKP